jgi:hypothetical protein
MALPATNEHSEYRIVLCGHALSAELADVIERGSGCFSRYRQALPVLALRS